MDIHNFLTTYLNPATYGMDAPTMAIILMVFGGTSYYLKGIGKAIWEFIKKYPFVSYSVSSVNTDFCSIELWLNYKFRYNLLPIKTYSSPADNQARWLYDQEKSDFISSPVTIDYGTYYLKIPGYPLAIVEKTKMEEGETFDQIEHCRPLKVKLTIKFLSLSKNPIIKMLKEAVSNKIKNDIDNKYDYIQEGYEWVFYPFTSRSLESVILDYKQKGNIVNTINSFFNKTKKEDYLRSGIPYKLNILLEGPPGTGKSSIIRALGTDLNIPIYFLSLSMVTCDAMLFKLIQKVHITPKNGKAILLIEDIDRMDFTHKISNPISKSGKDTGPTMSGLLNILDGPLTREGLCSIITTNHIEKLDPALIRPGRMDLIEKIDYLEKDLQIKLFCRLFDIDIEYLKILVKIPNNIKKRPASEIQCQFLHHLHMETDQDTKIINCFNTLFKSVKSNIVDCLSNENVESLDILPALKDGVLRANR